MDGLEKATPPVTATAAPREAAGPAGPLCCSTAAFPPDVVRSWMRDRRVLAGVGLAVGGSGLALGWDWLSAVGLAPLLVSAAPCLVMCVLGLCLMGRGHRANPGSPGAVPGRPAAPTDRTISR